MESNDPYQISNDNNFIEESDEKIDEMAPLKRVWGWSIFISIVFFLLGLLFAISSIGFFVFSGDHFYNNQAYGHIKSLMTIMPIFMLVSSVISIWFSIVLFLAGIRIREGSNKERLLAGASNMAVSIRLVGIGIIVIIVFYSFLIYFSSRNMPTY